MPIGVRCSHFQAIRAILRIGPKQLVYITITQNVGGAAGITQLDTGCCRATNGQYSVIEGIEHIAADRAFHVESPVRGHFLYMAEKRFTNDDASDVGGTCGGDGKGHCGSE
jgi:hypothetical protein